MQTGITTLPALLATLALAAPAAGAGGTAGLREALDRAIRDPGSRRSMVLVVECRRDAGLSTAKVFGDGLGIWNGERQFHVEKARVVSLLRALREADFPALDERYGGAPAPSATPEGGGTFPEAGYAVTITCRIDLALGGHHKEVVQLARGTQSPTLKRLAETLLGIAEPPARSGVTASNLRDGLEKIARGALAPETWVLTLHRKPDPDGSPVRRLLLTIAGSRATTRAYAPAAGGEKDLVLDLGPADIRRLARQLAAADPAGWPVNLYAREYTDLSIKVLGHETSVQARPFAGLQPTTHGEHQAAFEEVVAALVGVHRRILARGRAAAPAPGP